MRQAPTGALGWGLIVVLMTAATATIAALVGGAPLWIPLLFAIASFMALIAVAAINLIEVLLLIGVVAMLAIVAFVAGCPLLASVLLGIGSPVAFAVVGCTIWFRAWSLRRAGRALVHVLRGEAGRAR